MMKARPVILLLLVPLLCWALFGLLGDRAAAILSAKIGAKILAQGDGKFTDATLFLKDRLKDGTVLVTAACLAALVYLLAARANRMQKPARWIVQGWVAFVCVNLVTAAAAHTVLFWSLLYCGKNRTHNYTQYQIKRGLITESTAPHQAVLLGTSQTHTQIDPKVVNGLIGTNVWTTELHYPGSTMYDRILCLERLPKQRVDFVVTYISEADFYGLFDNGRMIYFFGFRDLGSYFALGTNRPPADKYLVSGLLGDVFPLYRVWDPLVARARFWQVEDAGQAQHDATLEHDLAERARRIGRDMRIGPSTAFQKQGFEALARRCGEQNCRLVICCGRLNPLLAQALDPALRQDMLAFLREQAARNPDIVLLEESQLPPQTEQDYEDLTHVTQAARERFSPYVAAALERLAGSKSR